MVKKSLLAVLLSASHSKGPRTIAQRKGPATTRQKQRTRMHQLQTIVVVIKIRIDQASFYGLVGLDATRLCSTILCTKQDVFFLEPYRANSLTSHEERRAKWPTRIREIIPETCNKDTKKKQRPIQPVASLPYSPQLYMINKVQALLADSRILA